MARILVFDSLPDITDSAARPCNWTWGTALSEVTAMKTMRVRIFNAAEDISVVGWEFLMSGFATRSVVAALRWWQEFYCDKAEVAYAQATGIPGNAHSYPRDWPDVNPLFPWMRETLALSGGLGVVNMYPAVRQTNMQDRTGAPPYADSLYFPLSVHALWVRLGIYVSIADSTGLPDPLQVRLKVFAHVGGHDERQYLEEHGDHPYAYNAFI